jgi:hypothetical protein
MALMLIKFLQLPPSCLRNYLYDIHFRTNLKLGVANSYYAKERNAAPKPAVIGASDRFSKEDHLGDAWDGLGHAARWVAGAAVVPRRSPARAPIRSAQYTGNPACGCGTFRSSAFRWSCDIMAYCGHRVFTAEAANSLAVPLDYAKLNSMG